MRSCGIKLSKLIQLPSTKHFRTHTGEKRTSNLLHGNSVKADSRLIAHACEDCHHPFTTKSNLYRHNRICSRRLANALRSPEPLVTSPQSFSFVYEDPSSYPRRRRRRAPESDQELIGLSNEYMNDEEHYGSEYDVDTDEAILAYHEGQGDHPHPTGAYHPHQYLPYHVPDHVRVDTRPTSPHIHQQLCDEAVSTSTTPSTETSPPPHPWTTANPYTVDAPAGESHYQPIAHANPYRSSMTAEDQITHVEHYASNHDHHDPNRPSHGVQHNHIGYGGSHERGSVGPPPTERPYSTSSMGVNWSARSAVPQAVAVSHIADGQGQAGSSSGVTHPYHPLHYPQPNWHDERYYWGYGNHEVTWTLAAFNEYRQLAPMQYDIHNACGPHDVRYPHYG